MTLRSYNSNNISISFAGIDFSEFADGNFLEIAYDSDQFTSVVGTDGTVSRSKTNDKRATITIRLMQTSPTNDVLSALANVDLLTDGGSGVGAFLVTDSQGTTLLSSANCWISKFADINYGREAQERAWTFQCDDLQAFIGGNV